MTAEVTAVGIKSKITAIPLVLGVLEVVKGLHPKEDSDVQFLRLMWTINTTICNVSLEARSRTGSDQ